MVVVTISEKEKGLHSDESTIPVASEIVANSTLCPDKKVIAENKNIVVVDCTQGTDKKVIAENENITVMYCTQGTDKKAIAKKKITENHVQQLFKERDRLVLLVYARKNDCYRVKDIDKTLLKLGQVDNSEWQDRIYKDRETVCDKTHINDFEYFMCHIDEMTLKIVSHFEKAAVCNT